MSHKVVFVTGASRSGTTMLSRIFGAHSEILGLKETHFFGDILPAGKLDARFEPERMAKQAAHLHARLQRGLFRAGHPDEADINFARNLVDRSGLEHGVALFGAATQAVAAANGKTIPCEQTPRNIFYASRLLQLGDDFRIVHIVRDPRSVAASQKQRWRRRQLGATRLPVHEMVRNRVSYHAFTVARMWSRATSVALSLREHSRFRIVRYEDVVQRPEDAVRDLCAFLEVDWQPAMLDIPFTGSSGARDSDRRGVAQDRVDSWRKVLTSSEVRHIEHACGNLMAHFDYLPSDAHGSAISDLMLWLQFPLHVIATALVDPRRMWIQTLAVLRR
ncbi:MAG TPA: sulfotransferase [Accumulibacter sp.]|nr:sulfotransferase [Accumulibacter sp.]